MSLEPPSSERDQRFNEVLTEYLEGLETGKPDDRTALLMRHADLADDLRAFFTRTDKVHELTSTLLRGCATETSFPPVPAEQFRIVREVGRGGMGIVYEAVDLNLGRRVALKVLRPHDQSDPRALQRFLCEARIVAQLHHTNIVPIFQVGEYEGLHYFAMEFIDGRGLDQVLHQLRQAPTRPLFAEPTPPLMDNNAAPAARQDSAPGGVGPSDRNGILSNEYVARIGVQVAEALAHAHEHGVLHRDIKPSNLLLDCEGIVWVTDFGLAKEGATDLTDPGEVVGTLRYLAPERFSGQVDVRGDVYSLGATLYELLVLQPVYEELDRAKLMARVLHDEPARPRQVDARIPRDLETVVLKALAKEPARRYQTAQALADDLRRFLDDVPIQARRASALERGWRWCRRNPGIAMSSTAAVLALLIGLGIALWQWQRADENARHAQANAAQAKKDFELAFQAIDQMLERVGGEHWLMVPHMDRTREALLQDAVRFYQNLMRGREDPPQSRFALARAYLRLGQMHDLLNHPEALRYLNEALSLVELLLAGDPSKVEYRRLAAAIYTHRGDTRRLRTQGDREADYRQALTSWASLSAEYPDHPPTTFGHAFTLLVASGFLSSTSRLEEAESLLRQSIAVAERLPASFENRSWLLASALRRLAAVLDSGGRLSESERTYRRALDLFDDAGQQSPDAVSRFEQATALKNLAQLQTRRGKASEAEQLFRQSVEIGERLVADFPDVPRYRFGLAETRNELGALLVVRGRTPEAEKVLERSVWQWRDLVAKSADVASYRVFLGAALHNLALQRRSRGDFKSAKALLEEAIAEQEQVARVNPEQASTLEFLVKHYRGLAEVLVNLRLFHEAEEAVSRQQALAKELAEKDGKSASILAFQARACENLAYLRKTTNRAGDAGVAYAEAVRHWRKLVADFPDNPSHASRLGGSLNDWAIVLRGQVRWADMIPLVDEAIRVQEGAVQARPEVPTYQQYLYNHYSVRGDARIGLGDHVDAFATEAALRKRFPAWFDDYLWAVSLAQCIPLAKKDSTLTEEKRDKLQQQYADEAMSLLRSAHQKQSKNLPQIHTNPAFRPLRDRPDFQELLANVAKPKSAK